MARMTAEEFRRAFEVVTNNAFHTYRPLKNADQAIISLAFSALDRYGDILVLFEHKRPVGVHLETRSIFEEWEYWKYIFERTSNIPRRAEAYFYQQRLESLWVAKNFIKKGSPNLTKGMEAKVNRMIEEDGSDSTSLDEAVRKYTDKYSSLPVVLVETGHLKCIKSLTGLHF